VALFFYTVNQVLVRLWTRAIDIDPSGSMKIPSFGRIVWPGIAVVLRANGNIQARPGSAPTVGGEGSEAWDDFVGWIFPRLRKRFGETAIRRNPVVQPFGWSEGRGVNENFQDRPGSGLNRIWGWFLCMVRLGSSDPSPGYRV
jgi:hypothetical protein